MTAFLIEQLHEWGRAHPRAKGALRLPGRLLAPFRQLGCWRAAAAYGPFIRDWWKFRQSGEPAHVTDLFPVLHEKVEVQSFDPHYFHQAVWTAKKIAAAPPGMHFDVGSQAVFVGMLTAIAPVTFIDLRPLGVRIAGIEDRKGTILDLPMANASVTSISCLHVIEHIGLGRYGDPIDSEGTAKAAKELSRVLAPGGSLYLSLPVGRPHIAFNAHRVVAADAVVGMFPDLRLVEFALVDDGGEIRLDAPLSAADGESFACGLFHFRRP